jgi:predicted acyltransferase
LWQGKGLAFDPEGLLSIKRLIFIGVLTLGVAQVWALVMPINKSLWTSMFVLFTSGIACLVLAFFVWVCDIIKHSRLIDPLIVYGSNSLFIYVLSGLWVTSYTLIMIGEFAIGEWLYQGLNVIFTAKLASFLYALLHVYVFWLIATELYKRKIFIKI